MKLGPGLKGLPGTNTLAYFVNHRHKKFYEIGSSYLLDWDVGWKEEIIKESQMLNLGETKRYLRVAKVPGTSTIKLFTTVTNSVL